ncbi:MAG: DNA polymerase I [Candidatus Magasanikbacteria bacterium]|nr:DNA polymerase I [Candidatus Magasanikbacteria bacterium]
MNKENMQKFVIIDGNAIIHRAYHALPPLTAVDGTVVNAVYGFSSMLLKVLSDLKPDYLALSFDVEGKTFRDEIYDDYKATRVKAEQELYDQIPLVHKVVEAFDIPIYVKKGYEADDVIGTLVKKVEKNKKVQSIIVTGDMDMLQLVKDKETEVYLLRKGLSDFELYDEAAVAKRFGFGPEFIVDYKAFRGDSSDNIPGIKGVGEKTATKLIQEIGGIDKIYKADKDELKELFSNSIVQKIINGKKEAEMSAKLACIKNDVSGLKFSLKNCMVNKFDIDQISSLFRKFEFYSLIKRIPGNESRKKIKSKKIKKTKLNHISDAKKLAIFFKMFKDHKIFACKEIVNNKKIINSDLVGFVLCFGGEVYFIEYSKLKNNEQKKVLQIFNDETKKIVGHNIKQLVKVLEMHDVEFKNELFDIMVASYIYNSSTRAHDLKSIVRRELDEELPGGSTQDSLFGEDPKLVAAQLIKILEIQKKQKNQLEEMEDLGLFKKVEMPLIPILARMELNGMAIDKAMLKKLSKRNNEAIESLTKKIWKEAGEQFNVSSSVQLREILYEKMDLPTEGIKKGKTGYSTAASELEKLRGVSPIIELIEEYRELEKLRNTYIDVLPTLINERTGRIHTSFNQTVTSTGRLSSSDPNLQNIPIRTDLGKEVRDAFIAEKDNILISADYSQIELRIVASLAKDEKMMEIFEKGEDIHKATAAVINGVKLEEVSKKMRYAAKEVNFGVLYGMGAYGLSWRAKISRAEAKKFIDKYFEEFSGVKKYIDMTLKFAKEKGYVETLFGRRRYIPELKSGNYQLRSAGERMAINMPIQGTAADLMKMAMIEVDKDLKEKFTKKDEILMILQVHDEIVLEVEKELEKKVSKIVKNSMESVANLRVPIEVHVNSGKRWGNIK